MLLSDVTKRVEKQVCRKGLALTFEGDDQP
jgi:hypothetical protein